MERKRDPVKAKKRRYDSARRQQQARETRDAIVEAARRRFLTTGFASTTIAAIATDVGVSVDTIYKSFGSKPGIVRAVCDDALAGAGPVPAETRSDALQVTATDPRALIRGWGTLTAEIAPRIAPILLLIRDAAAADPDMASLQTEMDDQRLERMTHNASNLATGGHLRSDVTVDEAGQILWIYSSPQLYELLVITRGWTLDRYTTFIADAIIAALLPARDEHRPRSDDALPTRVAPGAEPTLGARPGGSRPENALKPLPEQGLRGGQGGT
jgi:AcrR family transcriptional regulator